MAFISSVVPSKSIQDIREKSSSRSNKNESNQSHSKFEEGNTYFQNAAAGWDDRADMIQASKLAMKALLAHIPLFDSNNRPGKGLQFIEIGCGTGLLSFMMAPYCRSLLAVDACDAMIETLSSKLRHEDAPSNIRPLCAMLSDPEDPSLPEEAHSMVAHRHSSSRQKFDLAISHLLLHHIADLPALMRTIYGCLKPCGWVALTDFEDFGSAARLFHPKSKSAGVERHGIRKDEMERILKEGGFIQVRVETAFHLHKEVERWPGEWGSEKPDELEAETMRFPFLLCYGRKPREASSRL